MSELKAYQVICTDDIDRNEITENFSAPDFLAYDADEADKVIAEKDTEIAQLQAMLEERNKQVGELKGDIADLRDDKKLTDAILDERNAEIAEVKKACNDNLDWCLRTLKENRHHKYKRCLKMAKICEDKLGTVVKPGWWNKWYKRWLEIAKKVKEGV